MSIKQDAQKFLEGCQVIDPFEAVKGFIVCSDELNFKIVKVTIKSDDVDEEFVDEFALTDILDEDQDKMVLNFKSKMYEILGRKRYYIEKDVYQFLKDEEVDFDDDIDFDVDDAEERAKREAEEEEAAEQAFERFLRIQEEMD